MNKNIKIIMAIIIIITIAIIMIAIINKNKSENVSESNVIGQSNGKIAESNGTSQSDLDKLKTLFEENSVVKVYINKNATIQEVDKLYDDMQKIEYLRNVDLVTSLDAYQKMVDQYGENSDLVKSVDKYYLQESIWAGCYYLDDISLLDEDAYFEKVKLAINNIDTDNIIDNIVTAGIINIYNDGGMEAVDKYINKLK